MKTMRYPRWFFSGNATRCLAAMAVLLSGGVVFGAGAKPELEGRVMCGYQGWFNAEGDGAGRGWTHWAKRRGPMEPGNAKVDLWPDMTELGPDERFATGFRHEDGRVAEVFSSFRRETVLRHFRWMEEYGIDGVFVQRFIAPLRDGRVLRHNDAVLAHCREGASASGRVFAVMYDLSGLKAGRIGEVAEDWKRLRGEMKVTEDAGYLHHKGRPLVAVWGVGFKDGREYSLEECKWLVAELRKEGCAVMLGVPSGWRSLERDALDDPLLHEILAAADVVSPWTVGRYRTPEEADRHAERVWKEDLAWCGGKGIAYLPVVFPGFSWHNMKGAALDQIPRLRGRFLWTQMTAAKRAGAGMIYVAMFDEVDEGTAIFKCTNDPPVAAGGNTFLDHEGLPPDFYLRLTGAGARMLRGEIPAGREVPVAAEEKGARKSR